ncbi:MAG: recombinase family protein, partial [Oribacterium sp.]|nr:recombinase family protein [Oribacterium sp.]
MAVKKANKPVAKTAVIYARYSSSNQRDVSIDQQVAACKKYAESQDLQILKMYEDRAMTGTNDNRPG